jgi:hypothetical protein
MTMEKTIEDRLAMAAYSAACDALFGNHDEISLVFDIGEAQYAQLVRFIRVAGDVPGESVYRWSAARGLHVLPADGWNNVSPDIRLFFDAFTAVVKALAPILDPPAKAKAVPLGREAPRRIEDTIFEQHESLGAKEDAGGPLRSTGDVRVIPMQRPEEPQVPAPAAAGAGPVVFNQSDLDAFSAAMEGENGPRVTFDEGTLDKLRAERRKADPNDALNILAEEPNPGPAAEKAAPTHIEAEVNGEKIEGDVVVTRPANGRRK